MLTRNTPSSLFTTNSFPFIFETLNMGVDQLFQGFGSDFLHFQGLADPGGKSKPGFILRDEGDAFALTADIPGVALEDIHIDVTAEGLTLRGERTVEQPEGFSTIRNERSNLSFSKFVEFPQKVDVNQCNASLKNGQLRVTIAKAEELRPRKIEVQVSE